MSELTALDHQRIAAEVVKAQELLLKEEREKHEAQHRALEPLIEYAPFIIEYAEDLKQRREMRQRIYEKIIGALILGLVLSALGFIGRSLLGEVADKVKDTEQARQVIETPFRKEDYGSPNA